MKLLFEQLFYGRGARGYDILGFSPGAEKYLPRVQALCGAVGTPIGDYGGEPFLLSVPENDRVFMLCGRRGAPDSMGRATLIFHVLIAMKADLSVAKVDASSLFAQGAFSDKMPSGEIDSICVNVLSPSMQRSCGATIDVLFPCMFRSEVPSAKLVSASVGDRVLDLRWATFSFQALPDFDVQVLPPRVPGLRTANEYDASGNLLHGAAVANAQQVEERLSGGRELAATYRSSPIVNAPLPESNNTMLKVSVVINVVFAVVCAVLLASHKAANDPDGQKAGQLVVTNVVEKVVEKRVEALLTDEQRAGVEREFVKRLSVSFEKGKRISDFDAEVRSSGLPRIDIIMDRHDSDYNKSRQFIERVRAYVEFVNKNILEVKTP